MPQPIPTSVSRSGTGPADVHRAVTARLGGDPERSDRLVIEPPDVDGDLVTLHYELCGLARFEERYRFEVVEPVPALEGLVTRAAELLALFAGTSYYKATLPPRLEVGFAVPDVTADLVRQVYTLGLAELAYRNGFDLEGYTQLEVPDRPPAPSDVPLRAGPLVPVGGGKDSVVTVEALRGSLEGTTLFAVNPRGAISRVVERSGLAAITVRRSLDPRLLELNAAGAVNGHIPVTAIVSAAALVGAAMGGHRAVVMSNEASADSPTRVVDGREINHQWSKGSAFESALAGVVSADLHPGLTYLSFLRPATELAVARSFARLRQYHPVFTSCNRAFALDGRGSEWCGDCPKCRFVFLALAPFLERERLLEVFGGRDLLDDPNQLEGFAELIGEGAGKPFECVGDTQESLAALDCLAERHEWRGSVVVRELGDASRNGCGRVEQLVEAADGSGLPEPYASLFDASL